MNPRLLHSGALNQVANPSPLLAPPAFKHTVTLPESQRWHRQKLPNRSNELGRFHRPIREDPRQADIAKIRVPELTDPIAWIGLGPENPDL